MIPLLLALQLPAAPASQLPRLFVEGHVNRYSSTAPGRLDDRDTRIRLIRRFGFSGVRFDIEWERVERVRGRYDWTRFDTLAAEVGRQGLEAFGLLLDTPPWARPPMTPMSHRPMVEGSSALGDTLFAAFAAAAARRYRGRIDRWEIWNEPNVPGFWVHVVDGKNVGPSAQDYLTLFLLARDSIMAANPSAEVAVAGLASGEGSYRSLPDPVAAGKRLTLVPAYQYLADLLRLGLRTPLIGLHPYSDVPPGVRQGSATVSEFPTLVLDSVERVLDRAQMPEARIWVTEWGVNQSPGRGDPMVRDWFAAGLHHLMCDPRVAFVTIYTLGDSPRPDGFALLRPGGQLTSAGQALLSYVSSPARCT